MIKMNSSSLSLLLLAFVAVASAVAAVPADNKDCTPAVPCNATACDADPDCHCSGTEPLGIDLQDRPQIIYLTFDDALSSLFDTDYFSALFDGTYTNPNDCPIRATFFLTHESCEYDVVHKYYSEGHEMATHSVSHQEPPGHWEDLDLEGWRAEIQDMRYMIEKYALVPQSDIVGMRTPFLVPGGNDQFQMMAEEGIEYDSSMPSLEYGYTNLHNGRWPHSLDYASTMDCVTPPCPTCSFPGVWSQPILDLEDAWFGSVPGNDSIGSPCSMLDSCDFVKDVEDPDVVYEMLMKNFERAYNGNSRAPLGFFVHAAWFIGEEFAWRWEGYKMFLDEITDSSKYDDVWIVPVRAGIEYTKNPVPKDELNFYEPFGCFDLPKFQCSSPRNCRYTNVEYPDFEAQEIYMNSCVTCPPEYPWLGNPDGNERSSNK